MGEEIAFKNGRISDFKGLVTLTLDGVIIKHTVMHQSSTSTYIPHFTEIEKTFFGRLLTANFKVKWHKKLGQKSKIRSRRALGIVPYFKNPWSFASPHCKWGRRQHFKMVEFPTFKGSWPWPWLGSGHTAYRHASLVDLYLHTKFHWNQRNILWRDGWTDIWDRLY